VKRREFISLLGGAAAAWPVAARAQQAHRLRRVSILLAFAERDPEGEARVKALRDALEKFGWSINSDLLIDTRWTSGRPDQLAAHAADLVHKSPDIIVVSGTTQLQAVMRETTTIPIVFANVADPVADGLVASLARPGKNVTGITNYEYAITGKWLEILKETGPHIANVLVVYYASNRATPGLLRALQTAAKTSGVQLTLAEVHDSAEISKAFEVFAGIPNGALMLFPDANLGVYREQIITLATRHGLPSLFPLRYFVTAGGLMSYGVDPHDLFRQAASYVDRILKGEKPGDLPVQAPIKFELVINLKTAKALGIDVPLFLQQRADEVIE
jgi:ABC-type uncharacterized transport system substrate-binding protein